ncbi:hypothetical protein F5884DRAFT_195034 [Xylogone sp. PMI_703]|nr:hypothetical protein F5884DRAFT_195034 [Xylogone sp. PMI_703]
MLLSEVKQQLNKRGRRRGNTVLVPSWRTKKIALLSKIDTSLKYTHAFAVIAQRVLESPEKHQEPLESATLADSPSEITGSKPTIFLAFSNEHAQEMAMALAPITKDSFRIRVLGQSGFTDYKELREGAAAIHRACRRGKNYPKATLNSKISKLKAKVLPLTNAVRKKEHHYERKKPLKVFQLFSKLPPEVRRLIWTHAVNEPRTVDIRLSQTFDICKSLTPVPAVVQACQESRMVAMEIYNPVFQNSWMYTGVYVNFAVDTVRMNYETAERLCRPRDENIRQARNKIRFIHISMDKFALQDMANVLSKMTCFGPLGIWAGVEMWTFHFYESPSGFVTPEHYAELEIPRPENARVALCMVEETKAGIVGAYRLRKQQHARGGPIPFGIKVRYYN